MVSQWYHMSVMASQIPVSSTFSSAFSGYCSVLLPFAWRVPPQNGSVMRSVYMSRHNNALSIMFYSCQACSYWYFGTLIAHQPLLTQKLYSAHNKPAIFRNGGDLTASRLPVLCNLKFLTVPVQPCSQIGYQKRTGLIVKYHIHGKPVVSCEFLNAKCELLNAKCELANAKYELQNSKCKMSNAKWDMLIWSATVAF